MPNTEPGDGAMDVDVLKHLVRNDPMFIEDAADLGGHDPQAALGVAAFLLGNAGRVESLSSEQRFYWDKYVRPFLEDVPCDGALGDSGACAGTGKIDEESLLTCYQNHTFLCQPCRYNRETILGP